MFISVQRGLKQAPSFRACEADLFVKLMGQCLQPGWDVRTIEKDNPEVGVNQDGRFGWNGLNETGQVLQGYWVYGKDRVHLALSRLG
jgi:hypothetical protein